MRSDRCPECRGSGRVLLLATTRRCDACGGTGRAAAPGAPAAVVRCVYVASDDSTAHAADEATAPVVLYSRVEFDEHDQVVSETVAERWPPPGAGAGGVTGGGASGGPSGPRG